MTGLKEIFKKIIIYILQIESRLVLWRYKPKIIAITGSVGKTSTKDAVHAVISPLFNVRKSEKSFNSEIGLPLTILGCQNAWSSPIKWLENIFKSLWLIVRKQKYPEWLVLEVGVGKTGDMKKTASWLKTDVVIITAIGETPSHIEFFNSRKHLIEEKSSLIKTLKKQGLLILNADDEDVLAMKSKTKSQTITYGFTEGSDIICSGDSIFYHNDVTPEGVIFRVEEQGNSLPVVIDGVFGRNHIYASLCALTLVSALKLNIVTAIEALKNYDVPAGRMRLLKGINDTFIIDDTYNSSPLACESALRTLYEVKSKENNSRKIAILGDMLELGRHTLEAHKNIGKVAKENADILMVVGQRAEAIKDGAIDAGMNKKNIFEFSNSVEAGEFAKTFVTTGDLVLVKGSQGVRMERVVEAILLDQENKSKLLVRQDKEWQEKK